MRRTTALLVLTINVLGVYYPAIFAGVNSLDDFRMLDGLPQGGRIDLLNLFNPSHAIGYFRPLVILSYYLDNSVLDLPAQAMHLQNILIHLLNSLLVFMSGMMFFRKYEQRISLAFVAGCIFALHPLNVEAVAWISGRTDLLATLFALLALVCTAYFLDSGRLIWLWYAALVCTIGALAKETALFCLPAAYLLAITNDAVVGSAFGVRNYKQLFIRLAVIVVPFILTGLTYLSCRLPTLRIVTKVVTASQTNPGTVASQIDSIAMLRDALTTYGFYVKKLFFPLPLNFAITGISPRYLWLGIAVIALALYLSLIRRRNSIALQMLLACLCVLVSALVISRAGVAWTPYAERYLYLPTVFFAFGVVDAFRSVVEERVPSRFTQLGVFALLVMTAFITVQRTMVWQNNLTLYQDTIRKSPDFAPISNQLAIALSDENRLADAMKQIEVGKKSKIHGDMVLLYVNQASILGSQKKYDEAYRALVQTYKDKGVETAHIEVIKSYIFLMERDRVDTKDKGRSKRLLSRLADMHEIYYKRSGDTDHLYRAGQLALAGQDRAKAHRFFLEVAEKAPKESMFKEFGRKMARKTEGPAR
jgi:hypothetical protein